MAQLKQHRPISREAEGDERLIRYLLHESPPEEENAVEEQYFSDAALHERLLVVEDELIDSYVGGDLSPDRCELFEEWFLASPERREKVEIARSLASHVKSTADAARQTNRRSVHIFRNAMLAGATAAVLLAGAFLVLRRLGAPKVPQITVAKDVGPPAAAGPVAAVPAHTINPTDERSKREALAKNLAKAPTTDLAKATPSGAKLDQVEVAPPSGPPVGQSSNLPPPAFPSTEVREQPRPLPPHTLLTFPGNAGLGFLVVVLRGKVVMRDGSPPPSSAGIERVCSDPSGSAPGPITDRNGEYMWRMELAPAKTQTCRLRADLRGYTSSEIDISGLSASSNPNLPDLVLFPRQSAGADSDDPTKWRYIPLPDPLSISSLPLPPGIGGVYFGPCPAECLMFAFDVALPLLMEGKFRWTVNYEDANNFVLFEVDKQAFLAKRVIGGKVFVLARFQLHHVRDKFREYMEVTPAHINHAFSEGGETESFYSTAQPSHDLSQGRIGILVDKN